MTGAPWGGSEVLWAGAAGILAERGHHVCASVCGWPKRPAQIAALAARGVVLQERSLAWEKLLRRLCKRQGAAAAVYRLLSPTGRWLKRQRPDLICVSGGGSFDALRIRQELEEAQIPYALISQANEDRVWFSDAELPAAQRLFQNAAAFYFVSQGNLRLAEKQLAGRLPNARIARNPADLSGLKQPPPSLREADPVAFGCVGRLDLAAKGQDVLLEVLASSRWKSRSWRLTFAGQGPHRATIEALVDFHGLKDRVTLAGQVSDLREFWSGHSVCVQPSRYEGMALSTLEAMASSRPVVAAPAAGMDELVFDGLTGFLAKGFDAAALDAALENLWQRRTSVTELGVRARHHVETVLNPEPLSFLADQLERQVRSPHQPPDNG